MKVAKPEGDKCATNITMTITSSKKPGRTCADFLKNCNEKNGLKKTSPSRSITYNICYNSMSKERTCMKKAVCISSAIEPCKEMKNIILNQIKNVNKLSSSICERSISPNSKIERCSPKRSQSRHSILHVKEEKNVKKYNCEKDIIICSSTQQRLKDPQIYFDEECGNIPRFVDKCEESLPIMKPILNYHSLKAEKLVNITANIEMHLGLLLNLSDGYFPKHIMSLKIYLNNDHTLTAIQEENVANKDVTFDNTDKNSIFGDIHMSVKSNKMQNLEMVEEFNKPISLEPQKVKEFLVDNKVSVTVALEVILNNSTIHKSKSILKKEFQNEKDISQKNKMMEMEISSYLVDKPHNNKYFQEEKPIISSKKENIHSSNVKNNKSKQKIDEGKNVKNNHTYDEELKVKSLNTVLKDKVGSNKIKDRELDNIDNKDKDSKFKYEKTVAKDNVRYDKSKSMELDSKLIFKDKEIKVKYLKTVFEDKVSSDKTKGIELDNKSIYAENIVLEKRGNFENINRVVKEKENNRTNEAEVGTKSSRLWYGLLNKHGRQCNCAIDDYLSRMQESWLKMKNKKDIKNKYQIKEDSMNELEVPSTNIHNILDDEDDILVEGVVNWNENEDIRKVLFSHRSEDERNHDEIIYKKSISLEQDEIIQNEKKEKLDLNLDQNVINSTLSDIQSEKKFPIEKDTKFDLVVHIDVKVDSLNCKDNIYTVPNQNVEPKTDKIEECELDVLHFTTEKNVKPNKFGENLVPIENIGEVELIVKVVIVNNNSTNKVPPPKQSFIFKESETWNFEIDPRYSPEKLTSYLGKVFFRDQIRKKGELDIDEILKPEDEKVSIDKMVGRLNEIPQIYNLFTDQSLDEDESFKKDNSFYTKTLSELSSALMESLEETEKIDYIQLTTEQKIKLYEESKLRISNLYRKEISKMKDSSMQTKSIQKLEKEGKYSDYVLVDGSLSIEKEFFDEDKKIKTEEKHHGKRSEQFLARKKMVFDILYDIYEDIESFLKRRSLRDILNEIINQDSKWIKTKFDLDVLDHNKPDQKDYTKIDIKPHSPICVSHHEIFSRIQVNEHIDSSDTSDLSDPLNIIVPKSYFKEFGNFESLVSKCKDKAKDGHLNNILNNIMKSFLNTMDICPDVYGDHIKHKNDSVTKYKTTSGKEKCIEKEIISPQHPICNNYYKNAFQLFQQLNDIPRRCNTSSSEYSNNKSIPNNEFRHPQSKTLNTLTCEICDDENKLEKIYEKNGKVQYKYISKYSIKNVSQPFLGRYQVGRPFENQQVTCFVCREKLTKCFISLHEKCCFRKWVKSHMKIMKPYIFQRVCEQMSCDNVDYSVEDAISDFYYIACGKI